MKETVALAIIIVFGIPLMVWNGFVLATLWGWFIVPYFEAPALTVAMAVGITLVAGLFTGRYRPGKSDDALRHTVHIIIFSAGYRAIALGMGWIVTGFLP